MGVLISLFAIRKRNKIISEVKDDNAWLADRAKRLAQENLRLKIELRLITDSSIRLEAPVQKQKFGTPCVSPSLPQGEDES